MLIMTIYRQLVHLKRLFSYQGGPRSDSSLATSVDLDQVPYFVGPDLSPNCLQRLSAVHKNYHS